MYKLKPFIDLEKLQWETLCQNPLAIDLIEKNPDKIMLWALCTNSNAIHLIHQAIKKQKKVDWQLLSKNKGAISLLEKNMEKVDWQYLSANPSAIHLLEQYPENINWDSLSLNTNAIHLLEKNMDKIDWMSLSENPNAIDILRKHPEKMYMHFLCRNPNPDVVKFLDKTADAKEWGDIIDWNVITLNPNALHIIEKNMDKIDKTNIKYMSRFPNNISFLEKNIHLIDWWYISMNPAIFELDYDALKKRTGVYKEELIVSAMHPKRINKILKMSGEIMNIDDII